jgi:small-conductance mechanosensitive channel
MPLSRIIEQTVFFLLLIAFLITASRLMGLEAVARLLEQLLSYLPSMIAAVILFLLGGIAAKFMGDVVTAAATGAGLSYAPRLGRLVQYLISVIVVVLTLSVLGIDTALLVTAVTIALAAFGLALGLALGLGARSLVHHLLAGYYVRQRFTAGQQLGFGDIRGEVRGIGSVNTVVGTQQGDVVIPNGTLIESIMQASGPTGGQETNG